MNTFCCAHPEEMGVSSKSILRFLDYIEENRLELHGFMFLRHDRLISQGWWAPYCKNRNHMLFSLSKTFTSIAVGFAVQEGLLSVEDQVISFFPEQFTGAPCEYMSQMTVEHLLTMSTGHTKEPAIFNQPEGKNWASYFLTSYVDKKPGSFFLYNTAATHVLSAIVQKVSGKTVTEFLTPRLFEPLGIQNIWWEQSPTGVDAGGFGLNVKTEDIAKLGLFLLHKGAYGGKQLLNPAWIEKGSSKVVKNNGDTPDWRQGYGYQMWQCVPEHVYRGDGAFGQFCIVMPDQDAVIAINSGEMNMQKILDGVWNILLPGMETEPLPEAPGDYEILKTRLDHLTLSRPVGSMVHSKQERLAGTYQFGDNILNLTRMAFDFSKENPVLQLERGSGMRYQIVVGKSQWIDNRIDLPQDTPEGRLDDEVSCFGAWDQNGCYQFVLQYPKKPFADYFVAEALPHGIRLRHRMNVSMKSEDMEEDILLGVKME